MKLDQHTVHAPLRFERQGQRYDIQYLESVSYDIWQ